MVTADIISEERKPVIMADKIKSLEPDYDPIGLTLKNALHNIKSESRLVVGLAAAIKVLSNGPEESLICILAESKHGDSVSHIHQVLLEAFCYENDIYVIKVDSDEKLSNLLNEPELQTCCLIQKTLTDDGVEKLSKYENTLVDYCEANWDSPKQPVIKLPDV